MNQLLRRVTLGGLLAVVGVSSLLFAQAPPDDTADAVYGQGSFTGRSANRGQTNPSAITLFSPAGIAIDRNGGVYIVDQQNHRVLFYPSGSQTPTLVYGQTESFETGQPNKNGMGPGVLNNPNGVAVDDTGLYVADFDNHRVLHFPPGSTTADRVYGQNSDFTTRNANLGSATPSRTSLNNPSSVAVDADGGLYVADFRNNRVLHYPSGSTIPDRVYGQGGSFTTATANAGGLSAASLRLPMSVTVEPGGLYVADRDNVRVLHYTGESVIADRVYGQGNSFTSAASNLGGVSRESLQMPIATAIDGAGGLYVSDTANHRVLHYPAGSTVADRVYGQGNAFNTGTPNKGGSPANASGFLNPFGLAVDGTGALYAADTNNHRALRFDAPPAPAPTVSSFTTNPNPPVAGQAFTFMINGANFNPANVTAEFTGPGCNPCLVSNAQLSTKTTSTVGGSLTVATAGTFSAMVRNGGTPSQALSFAVTAAGGGGGGTGGGGGGTGGGGGSPAGSGQILSHIADSTGWTTSVTLVNLDTVPAEFSLRFFGSATTGRSESVPMDLAFKNQSGRASLVEGVIPVGGSRTIETAGNDTVLNMGWVELTTTKRINGFGIFRDGGARQEASVGLTPAVAAFLLPFDNTGGRDTSYAIINRNSTDGLNATAIVRDENGNVLSSGTVVALPRRGHKASTTTSIFPASANTKGTIEFRTTSGDITGLGFRFDPPPVFPNTIRAFTSVAVIPIN